MSRRRKKWKRQHKGKRQNTEQIRNNELNHLIAEQALDMKYSGSINDRFNHRSKDIFDRRKRSSGSGFYKQ
jgi:hypothetical protein